MNHLSEFLDEKVAYGQYAFVAEEALERLSITKNALNCGVYKLKKKNRLISLADNFYGIVPDEYRVLGSLPAEEAVSLLFKHWNEPYYVCLLSAALYHGASHQKPQTFQVMSSKRLASRTFGKIKIDFIYKNNVALLPTQQIEIKTGYLTVATPELTAWDLFLYPNHVGGLNHIATVLTELVDVMDVKKLIALIEISSDKAWVQRLGYILDLIDPIETQKRDYLVNELYSYFEEKITYPVALVTSIESVGFPRDNRWKIIENAKLESDI